jgi:hypothetical protein
MGSIQKLPDSGQMGLNGALADSQMLSYFFLGKATDPRQGRGLALSR